MHDERKKSNQTPTNFVENLSQIISDSLRSNKPCLDYLVLIIANSSKSWAERNLETVDETSIALFTPRIIKCTRATL